MRSGWKVCSYVWTVDREPIRLLSASRSVMDAGHARNLIAVMAKSWRRHRAPIAARYSPLANSNLNGQIGAAKQEIADNFSSCDSAPVLPKPTNVGPKMIDDQDLGFFANFLGIFIFILVIAYHYVMADPKYEGSQC
ncbi:unnamed protein product [Musa hybrid cultivar]